MKTTKVITTQLKALDYYSLITPEAVKEYYSKQISGRCTHEMYVLRVKNIIERSPWIKLVDTKYPGAQAAIRAEIEGLVLPEGYIVPSCKIIEVSQTNIVFTNSYVYGICPITKEISFLKKDMIVPMRVAPTSSGKDCATYVGEKISITAKLFRHDWPWPVVAVVPGGANKLPEEILTDIAELEEKIAKLAPEKKLFPIQPSKGGPKNGAKRLDLAPIPGTNVSLSECIDGTYYESTNKDYTVRLPVGEAMLFLAQLYISYCNCLLHMAEDYSDNEIVKKHMGLFRYIGRSQQG